jgi:hypothetical protein
MMTDDQKIEDLEALIRILTATGASKKRLDALHTELKNLRKNDD